LAKNGGNTHINCITFKSSLRIFKVPASRFACYHHRNTSAVCILTSKKSQQ